MSKTTNSTFQQSWKCEADGEPGCGGEDASATAGGTLALRGQERPRYNRELGGVMSSGQGENGLVRMELKYCEHCGGLWIREGGAVVYCQKCVPKVAQLPAPKKKPGRVRLPTGPRSLAEEYGDALPNEGTEFEAMGGVA